MITHAENIVAQQILIEFAGVFWLFCEAIILVLVRAGRRHTAEARVPATFSLDRRERRLLTLLLAGAAVVLLVVPGRYWLPQFHPNQLLDATPDQASAFYQTLTRPHLAIWTGFVAGWVALEIAIVWNGVMLYRRVRSILNGA